MDRSGYLANSLPKLFETVRTGGRVEQHVTTAGRVNYELNAESPKSSLEPFRMNQKVDETGDSFRALEHDLRRSTSLKSKLVNGA